MGDAAGGSAAGNWCLIESDPAVFSELIEKFGKMYIIENNDLANIFPT